MKKPTPFLLQASFNTAMIIEAAYPSIIYVISEIQSSPKIIPFFIQ
jgi:hypothetical protein